MTQIKSLNSSAIVVYISIVLLGKRHRLTTIMQVGNIFLLLKVSQTLQTGVCNIGDYTLKEFLRVSHCQEFTLEVKVL